MGIEGFFKTIKKKPETGIKIKFNDKLDVTDFYFDFNSILYQITAIVEEELGLLLAYLVYNDTIHSSDISRIAKAYNFIEPVTVDSYIERMKDPKSIENIIIIMIKKHVKELLDKYIVKTSLKRIYISFDGIPVMAKIIEQKHRKYMGYVNSELNKKIYAKTSHTLSEKRILVETNKYKYNRGNLVTWSGFMTQLEEEMGSNDFIEQLKSTFPNLEQVVVSGVKVPGEGEKKIVEDIIERKHITTKSIIMSPDADVILLAILCELSIDFTNKIDVLHYSPDVMEYEYVNTTMFIDYICKYIIADTPLANKPISEQMKKDIASDFIFISVVFGNDFLPKIQSINVKTDFELILRCYRVQLGSTQSQHKTIVKKEEQFSIDYDNFKSYFKALSIIEDDLIRYKYIADTYDMYAIKSVYGWNSDNQHILTSLYNYFKTYCYLLGLLYQPKPEIQAIIEQINKQDPYFWYAFQKFELKDNKTIEDQLNYIVTLSKSNKNKNIFPLSALKKSQDINQYQKDQYRKNKVIDYLITKDGFTLYDNEIIKLEWKLGDYRKLVNAELDQEDAKFGMIGIDLNKREIIWKTINYNTYNKLYMKSNNRKEALKKANDYIIGIYWVFDQYFNKNDRTYNYNNVSSWFYPNERSPLIHDIVAELEDPHEFEQLSKYNVIRENYFTKVEHMLYTVPTPKLLKEPYIEEHNQYQQLIKSHQDIFVDIDKQIDEIWNGNGKDYIDCRRITFITKCILEKVPNKPFKEFMEIVKPLRVKGDKSTEVSNQNTIIDLHKINFQAGGQTNKNTKKLFYKGRPIFG